MTPQTASARTAPTSSRAGAHNSAGDVFAAVAADLRAALRPDRGAA